MSKLYEWKTDIVGRILGYFQKTEHGNRLLMATYIFDCILLLDIFISLRTAIVTPHGITSAAPSDNNYIDRSV